MTTFIALLRGINVSGHNKIKMAALKALLTRLGFHNVTTYIQSGNVILQSDKHTSKAIEHSMTAGILSEFGHTVEVMVIERNALTALFGNNPFLAYPEIESNTLAVMILKDEPDTEGLEYLEELTKTIDESIALNGSNLYLHYPNGFGRSKLSNNFLEKKLKAVGTTRNWKTITKLVELSNTLS